MTTPVANTEPRSRALPRFLVLVLLTLTAGVGLAGPASAHNVLISSDPSEDAVVQTAPPVITLTFDEPVQDFQPVVTVLGPDGQKYESGAPQVDSTVVTTPLGPLPSAGDYVIAYRVVSADGHPVQGEVHFRLAAAPPSSSAASTTSSAPTSSAPTSSRPTSSGRPSTSPVAPTSSAPPSTESASTAAASSAAAPTAPTPTTAAVAPSSSSSGLSGWAWAAIALVAALIVAAAVVIVRRTRQRS